MIAQVIQQVADMSGQSDRTRILAAINAAAQEIWNTFDLPGSMREIRVSTDSNKFITLPWYVLAIRMIRNAHDRNPVDLVTAHRQYQAYKGYQNPYQWRVISRTPLLRAITTASTLTVSRLRADQEKVTVTITGVPSYASRVIEPIVFEVGQQEIETEEAYREITAITKSATTKSDFEIKDAKGTVIAMLPNHLLSAPNWLIQVLDRCDTTSSANVSCFDVLYKPVLGVIEEDGQLFSESFPEQYEQVVIFKALEQLYLAKEDMLPVAMQYNQKARALVEQFTAHDDLGKTLTLKLTPSSTPVTRYYGNI